MMDSPRWREHWYFAASAARHSSDAAVLEGICVMYSDVDSILVDVSKNRNVSLSLLDKLALDKESRVRQAVAGNPRVSAETLEILAKDEDHSVRLEITQRWVDRPLWGFVSTPVYILEMLAADAMELIRSSALEAIEEQEKIK